MRNLQHFTSVFKPNDICTLVELTNMYQTDVFFKLITPMEVAQVIDNINPKKAHEIVEIFPGLLKELP